MSHKKGFKEKSYEKHAEHFNEYSSGGEKEAHAKTWFENDTIDAWRHQRMYQVLDPILTESPHARWLTVGDGRYGKDAKYICDKGCDALATDISDVLLKEAKHLGYISEYKQENAESLSFKSAEFDYVFCKESYHHFPRPMIALYEMLRVANRGVVLIEPNDTYLSNRVSKNLFRGIKNFIKVILGRDVSKHGFESSGNYLYAISRREIEKVALGLNYPVVVFKGINDAYFTGAEYEKISANGAIQKKIKALVNTADLVCKLGLMDYGILAAIIFKERPSKTLIDNLRKNGCEVVHLPENPYI